MLCFGVFGTCLLVFADLFLVILELIIVGCGILVGKGVVMVLLPGRRSLHLRVVFYRLLVLFGCPKGSAAALLAGVLPLRYCSARFACKFPTWELPVRGHVRELVTESGIDGQVLRE